MQAEGKRVPFVGTEHIDTDALETFEIQPVDNPQTVQIETPEFSAVCPYSGLPDIATVTIAYVPDTLCIELKSLKYYFLSYRNVGIYQEHATDRIWEDLYNVLWPKSLTVHTVYNVRGGMETTCVRSSL